ncbi:unnamed protein product [Choristocarpus tenellus]
MEDGFDLDLTYITERIIVHGFPATGVEHIYRNPRTEVCRLLDKYHANSYYVYNFTSEPGRIYPAEDFHGRVERFPFTDHTCPPLRTVVEFCESAKAWLDSDENNVVSLHCKAGKGRAGIMATCLMVRMGSTVEDAISTYNSRRVSDFRGLTVVNQRKWVFYYERVIDQIWGLKNSIGMVPGQDPNLRIPVEPPISLGTVLVEIQPGRDLKDVATVLRKPTCTIWQQWPKGKTLVCRMSMLERDSTMGTGPSSGSSNRTSGTVGTVFEASLPPGVQVEGTFEVMITSSGGSLKSKGNSLDLWCNTALMQTGGGCDVFDQAEMDISPSKLTTKLQLSTVRVTLFHSPGTRRGSNSLVMAQSAIGARFGGSGMIDEDRGSSLSPDSIGPDPFDTPAEVDLSPLDECYTDESSVEDDLAHHHSQRSKNEHQGPSRSVDGDIFSSNRSNIDIMLSSDGEAEEVPDQISDSRVQDDGPIVEPREEAMDMASESQLERESTTPGLETMGDGDGDSGGGGRAKVKDPSFQGLTIHPGDSSPTPPPRARLKEMVKAVSKAVQQQHHHGDNVLVPAGDLGGGSGSRDPGGGLGSGGDAARTDLGNESSRFDQRDDINSRSPLAQMGAGGVVGSSPVLTSPCFVGPGTVPVGGMPRWANARTFPVGGGPPLSVSPQSSIERSNVEKNLTPKSITGSGSLSGPGSGCSTAGTLSGLGSLGRGGERLEGFEKMVAGLAMQPKLFTFDSGLISSSDSEGEYEGRHLDQRCKAKGLPKDQHMGTVLEEGVGDKGISGGDGLPVTTDGAPGNHRQAEEGAGIAERWMESQMALAREREQWEGYRGALEGELDWALAAQARAEARSEEESMRAGILNQRVKALNVEVTGIIFFSHQSLG